MQIHIYNEGVKTGHALVTCVELHFILRAGWATIFLFHLPLKDALGDVHQFHLVPEKQLAAVPTSLQ
jgi:hypothetical protein